MPACSTFRGTLAAVFCLSMSMGHAEPLAPAAKVEVGTLLSRLAASGCQFNRNGTWYSGQDARSHLQRKLDQVEKQAKSPTAEAFIELAASTSSMTGKPYLVKCPGEAPVASAVWLTAQLTAIRQR